MPIQWERYPKVARFLDPRHDHAPAEIACEVRRDPLTGRSGRVAHVLGFHLAPVDFGPMIEETRSGCPFCPDRVLQVTPLFPESVVATGRIRRGEAVVFPNLAPYDEHSAVVAMTTEHYVPIEGFSVAQLSDAFGAALEFFHIVSRQPRTPYALAFWNYLPASGGTQIHPHLQIAATDTPGNTLEQELQASRRYADAEGHSFWSELIQAERRAGERFLAHGSHTAWMTDFVSQSLLADILVIFPERRSLLELSQEALDEFYRGLTQVLAGLRSTGVYSFNLAWYSATPDRDDFWLHARLSPRVYMAPRVWGTDVSALQMLYREHFMVQTPEDAAQALRPSLHL
ncbi:MAG: hypothetical protein C5B60_12285 [Chloroflexi bacterium]|nr:MAG: hypothetical protein C5B60_12285 [Chloroflexota bacterium]